MTDTACGHLIIDCHIHPWADAAGLMSWYQPFAEVKDFVNLLRREGISRACGSCIKVQAPTDPVENLRMCNREASRFHDLFRDFYYPAIYVDPRAPEASCREIEHYHKHHGVRWIGELVGYIVGHGGDYLPPDSEPIYDLASELGLPVNIHCGELEQVDRLCRAFSRLNVVLAHPGNGRNEFLERLELVASLPNLYFDLSGSGLMRWGVLRAIIDRAGAHKVLFGTDAPICNPGCYVRGVLAENLTDAEREAVFSGNFLRLTGLAR